MDGEGATDTADEADQYEMEMKRKERELWERAAKWVRKEKECLERESVRELEGQHGHKGKGRIHLHQGFQGVVFQARQEQLRGLEVLVLAEGRREHS